MMSIGMHCRLLGRPGRIVALQRFLDHIGQHDRVWVCRRLDIARHWKPDPPVRPLPARHSHLQALTMPLTLTQLNSAALARPHTCWTACTSTRPGLPRRRWHSGRLCRWRSSSTPWLACWRRRAATRNWR